QQERASVGSRPEAHGQAGGGVQRLAPERERSAAHFIAHKTGTSVGRTQAALETAERLAQLPATAEAFRAGTLSEIQAEAVASAAAANPNEERRLLERPAGTYKHLRDECRRARHA